MRFTSRHDIRWTAVLGSCLCGLLLSSRDVRAQSNVPTETPLTQQQTAADDVAALTNDPSADPVDDTEADQPEADEPGPLGEEGDVAQALEAEASADPDVGLGDGRGTGEDSDDGGWLIIPFVNFSPETSLAGGLGYFHYFRVGDAEDTRLSSIRAGVIYSLESQLVAGLFPEFYFDHNRFHLKTHISYSDFPSSYWGVGATTSDSNEESYGAQAIGVRNELLRHITDDFYLGVMQDFEYLDVSESIAGGLLEESHGAGGGIVNGLGVFATYDSRDCGWSTAAGQYHRLSIVPYYGFMGSDYDFTHINLDSRWFFSLLDDHVLALQTFLDVNLGEPAFNRLAALGGSSQMRGFHEGRYRDNHQYALQAEYRFPIIWRFGGAAFGSIGQVFGEVADISAQNTQWAVGSGLRFAIDEAERINLRADFGYGRGGNMGFYFSIGEAF